MPRDVLPYVDKRDKTVDTVFLLPCGDADIYAEAVREGISRTSDELPAYAASLFLLRVRGLPLSEMTVKTPSCMYEIKITENDGKCGILVPKCKLLYTKTASFADKTDITVYTMSLGEMLYNVVLCADSNMLSEVVLHRLLHSDSAEKIAAAAAVSGKDGSLLAKAVYLDQKDRSLKLNLALAIASRARFSTPNERLNIKISGTDFCFMPDGNRLLAYDPEPSVFTFRAPDFTS